MGCWVVLVIKPRLGELFDEVYFLITHLEAQQYAGKDLAAMYSRRGKAEMHQGEIKAACQGSLRSSPRPKSHYRNHKLERKEVAQDAVVGAENAARLQLYRWVYET